MFSIWPFTYSQPADFNDLVHAKPFTSLHQPFTFLNLNRLLRLRVVVGSRDPDPEQNIPAPSMARLDARHCSLQPLHKAIDAGYRLGAVSRVARPLAE